MRPDSLTPACVSLCYVVVVATRFSARGCAVFGLSDIEGFELSRRLPSWLSVWILVISVLGLYLVSVVFLFFFFNDPAPPEIYPLPLHDALPILAWLLARVEFSGRRVVRALVPVPLVLPPVVGGVALLLVFGRRGLLGGWLDSTFGIPLPLDRKSTRLNSSHDQISYAVFCLKKKK